MAEKEKVKKLPSIKGADPVINMLRTHGLSVRGSDDAADIPGWVHTGNYALNWAVSGRFFRGWPLTRIVELFGDPSTGKSFLIYRAIAEVQREEGVALLDDTENALNHEYVETKLGVNPKRLAYVDPRSETIVDHIEVMKSFLAAARAIELKHASVAALDSLGHLTTEHERDVTGVKDMTRAQDIYKLYRIIGGQIASLPIVYIVANHKITSFSQWTPDESGGGKGSKFAASIRLDLRGVSKLKDRAGDFAGVIVTAHVVKNRIVTPWRQVRFAIPFTRPIREVSGLVNLLLERKILTTTTSHTLVYQGEDTGIKANKTDFLSQDISGEELLQKYPTLLEDLDKRFDAEEKAPPSDNGDLVVDEEDE